MTSFERVMAALSGGKPDRTPVFPITRDWCFKQSGFTVAEALTNPQKSAYAQYACLRRFGYDGVYNLCGTHAESEAMGCVLRYYEDAGPSVMEPAVKDFEKDLPRLRLPDPYSDGQLPRILQITRALRELCEEKAAVFAYLQSPLRHASMMRGTENALLDMLEQPDEMKALLEICTHTQIIWGAALARAGAHVLVISDPTGSADVISPAMYKEFDVPSMTRLIHALKRTGAKVMIHACGNYSDRLEPLACTGADGLSLDSKVDLGRARQILGNTMCLMGNVDPTGLMLKGSPEQVYRESIADMEKAGKSGTMILSAGCQLPRDTPPENMEAMVRAAREWNPTA